MDTNSFYEEIKPVKELENFVHSFWCHKNQSDKPELKTIVPDGFFKIIFVVVNNQIKNYFLTGIWTENKDYTTPPNSKNFGCRLNLLAPEYLLQSEIATIKNSVKQLPLSFLNASDFNFRDFTTLCNQWQKELLLLKPEKEIASNKLRFANILYSAKGELSATEISEQIFWSNRQINRYLNKWAGISLKSYLSIQRCYQSYFHIRKGELHPEKDYFDQSHFIREIKKHTGETPSKLYEGQNDRFIQLKNMRKK